MDRTKNFSIAPTFDSENGDILVPIEILDNIPSIEYTIDNANRIVIIKKQNRKIELNIANNKAFVNNFEVVVDCVPVIEKSIYQIPINFTVSNLGYYFQYDEQKQNVKIVYKNDDRILLNTNRLSFQFEKMSFNHTVPVLIGIQDKEYEKIINQYFDKHLQQNYNTYRELYEKTIKNNAENTLFTHNNYVRKQYFTENFGSILIIDNDTQSLEDSDLN